MHDTDLKRELFEATNDLEMLNSIPGKRNGIVMYGRDLIRGTIQGSALGWDDNCNSTTSYYFSLSYSFSPLSIIFLLPGLPLYHPTPNITSAADQEE